MTAHALSHVSDARCPALRARLTRALGGEMSAEQRADGTGDQASPASSDGEHTLVLNRASRRRVSAHQLYIQIINVRAKRIALCR